jgi:hypothetical protein
MEDVLEIYHRPYDPNIPVVCMDEQPVQLIEEMKIPLPLIKGKPFRYDYEYKRNGTANNFMFTEPLTCWRKVNIRKHKTRIDWALEIKELLDIDYPKADKVILICDNLNTHRISSLYEAFPANEARQLIERLEIHHTPKHGSWLNIAEIELSVLTDQCIKSRIPTFELLQQETKAWWTKRNASQKFVDWQFKTEDARIKLKRLYPQF